MRREMIVAAASVLAMTLGLVACTTATPESQVAEAGAKPKQTYNPMFQNGLDALNNPAVGFSSAGPRQPGAAR